MKLSIYILPFFICCFFQAYSQNLTGPSSVTQGQEVWYEFDNGSLYKKNKWRVNGGQITESISGSLSNTAYKVKVLWTDSGNGEIAFQQWAYNPLLDAFTFMDIESKSITVSPGVTPPASFAVTGGGTFCEGGSGVTVNLSGSEIGVAYYLVPAGDRFTNLENPHLDGTGGPLDWQVTGSGSYEILAYKDRGFYAMNGSATVGITSLPTVYSLANTGIRCYDVSSEIVLGSSQSGITYELYRNNTYVSSMNGTGSSLSFGQITIEGVYKVKGVNAGCNRWMSGEITLNKKPGVFNVSGVETSCEGPLAGSSIYLDGSETGASYELYRGTEYIESVSGTGNPINSSIQTTDGIYTYKAVKNGCYQDMNGSVNMVIKPVPNKLSIDNPGTRIVCEGSSTTLILRNTETGVIYTADGISKQGGGDLSWTISGEGSYGVNANFDTVDPCIIAMDGAVTIQYPDSPQVLYTVAGGGEFCAGTSGVSVYLEGNPGINDGLTYYLTDPRIPVPGSEKLSNGTPLVWDNINTPGKYSIAVKKDGCYFYMNGEVDVIEKPLPEVKTLEYPASFCKEDTPVLTIKNSQSNVFYQLFNASGEKVSAVITGDGTDKLIPLSMQSESYKLVAVLDGCQTVLEDDIAISFTNISPIDFYVSTTLLMAGDVANIMVNNINYYDSFEWYKDGEQINVTGNILSVGQSGLYELRGTLNSCQDMAKVQIDVMNDYNAINGIIENTANTSIIDVNEYDSKTDNFHQKIWFIDGIGRTIQTLETQNSQAHYDVITPMVYDKMGRNKYQYLPYTSASLSGEYRSNALNINYIESDQYNFYQVTDYIDHDQAPHTTTTFESSPLNRIISQTGSGIDWQSVAVRYEYNTNDSMQVKLWAVDLLTGDLTDKGFYLPGSLKSLITIDENGNRINEYQDKLGRTILKRVQAHENGQTEQWADTYYVYDDFGNLKFVLPPMATEKIASGSLMDDDFLSKWAFCYKYDSRSRMVEKRVPGAGWVFMVYDAHDRLVLTQDGLQRQDNQWVFTKYDILNRPVATGLYTDTTNISRLEMQTFINNKIGVDFSWYESHSTAIPHGYTDFAFPNGIIADDYLTITYYDDYSFKSLEGFELYYDYDSGQLNAQTTSLGSYPFPSTAFDRVKGQVTGSKIKVLDGNNTWLHSVTYYDDRYRPIQTVSQNYTGNIDKHSTLYNFPGWVLATKTSHKNGADTYEIKKRFTYDHAGRLMQGYHEVIKNGISQGEVLLAENKYNELGELIEKNLHVDNGAPHQSIDYRYNIRGWLESVNNSSLQITPTTGNNPDDVTPDLFGMELIYNDLLNGIPSGN